MASESGFSNQKKLGTAQFKTIHNVGGDKYGQSVASKALYEKSPEDTITVTDVIGNSGQIEFLNVQFVGHNALANDVLRINAGAYTNFEFDVISIVDIDNFLILPLLPSIDISGELAIIMSWVTNKANADGSQIVTLAPVPLQFVKDSTVVNVNEDTATPANNLALPAGLFIYKDGVQIPVTKDTGTPANNVGIPVEIVAASGTPINITAGDINVQLTDLGANFDAVRLGDGTGNYVAVNASDEALVHDADVLAQTVLLVAKDFATSAKQDLLLAELQLKADLTETQPVSLASVPLATGAATEAKQDTGNTSLAGIGTNTVNIPNVIATEGGAQPSHGLIVMGHTGAGVARHLLVDGTGRLNTNVTASVLPTGASTLAEQQGQSTTLNSIDSNTNTISLGIQTETSAFTSVSMVASGIDPSGSTVRALRVNASNQLLTFIGNTSVVIQQSSQAGPITSTQKSVGLTAVRATVSGSAPLSSRKKVMFKPSKNNTGSIYIGSSSVTIANGMEIIGPDRLEFTFDSSDYYLISDVAGQVVEIVEVA